MKKVIFTQRVEVISSYDEVRDCADQRISDFIFSCGYLPLPLPNHRDIVEMLFKEVRPDGIILTGGNSLEKHGGNAPMRDEVDHYLIQKAIEDDLPLYGFCRGMQSILDYFGEELIEVAGHVAVYHEVTGEFDECVNSYHCQGCVQVKNKDIVVTARAKDGVIEAIQHRKHRIYGTMWHPEREKPYLATDQKTMKKMFCTEEV